MLSSQRLPTRGIRDPSGSAATRSARSRARTRSIASTTLPEGSESSATEARYLVNAA